MLVKDLFVGFKCFQTILFLRPNASYSANLLWIFFCIFMCSPDPFRAENQNACMVSCLQHSSQLGYPQKRFATLCKIHDASNRAHKPFKISCSTSYALSNRIADIPLSSSKSPGIHCSAYISLQDARFAHIHCNQ